MRRAMVMAMAIGAGCGSSGGGTSTPPDPEPRPVDRPPPPSEPEPESSPAPGAAPSVRLIATPDGRGAAIEVTNTGATEVRLRPSIAIEGEQSASWRVATPAVLELRWDCQTPAPSDCVTLAPGASFHPPDWLGTLGDIQCICTRCVPAPPGRYRLVGESCEGARLEGTPFELAEAR